MISIIARWCPVSVLILGLISCNQKDLKTLNIPQPTWESERSSESFLQTERSLTDQLSFAKSPSAMLRATARCEDRDRKHTQARTQFSLPGKVPLYSMVPRELLKPNALNNDVHCSFSFEAFDAQGASHTFSLGDLKINNSNLAGGIESLSREVVQIPSRDTGFSFVHPSKAEMIFWCTDFSISVPTEDRREIFLREITFPSDFSFGRANQKCRVLAIQNKQVAMVSAEQTFHFRPELQFEARAIKGIPLSALETPYYAVKLGNDSEGPLRLRWPKSNFSRFFLLSAAIAQTSEVSFCPGTNVVRVPTTARIEIEKKENLKWLETPDYYQFEIPPNTAVTGSIKIKVSQLHIAFFNLPTSIRTFQPLELYSYTGENWLPLEKLNWQISDHPAWNGNFNFPAVCGG